MSEWSLFGKKAEYTTIRCGGTMSFLKEMTDKELEHALQKAADEFHASWTKWKAANEWFRKCQDESCRRRTESAQANNGR